MSNKPSDDFLIEEYKLVCKEKDFQYKARDFTTVLALTAGLSILGFLVKRGEESAIMYVLSLVVVLVLYINYVTRSLLGLKADTYIRYFIEPKRAELRWHTRKTGYSIGVIYHVYRVLVPILYGAIVAGNLYYIYIKGGCKYFLPSILIAVPIIGVAVKSQFYKSDVFMNEWKNIEAREAEKLKTEVQQQ